MTLHILCHILLMESFQLYGSPVSENPFLTQLHCVKAAAQLPPDYGFLVIA